MSKCPKCHERVNAYRDAFGKLVVTDPRIKVYTPIEIGETEFRYARIEAVRTTMHEAEHAPFCGGRK